MSVSSTTTKNTHDGNGTQHQFAYQFKIFANGDLTVLVRSSTGTETLKVLDTDYIVTNAGNANGGNILFKYNTGNTGDAHYSATDKRPQSGEKVIIRRSLTLTQGTDYVENDPFPAASHEDALDRLTFITQQIQENVDRSIQLSRTNTMTSTEFAVGATDRANKILAFDSSGELSVTQELGTYRGTDTTTTTSAYNQRDIIKSTSSSQLNNVYICVADAVVGDLLTDTDHFELLVDAVSAATSATNAASSAGTASTDAGTATTKASEAAASATKAENYAIKIDGEAESGVGEASAKAHAIGDTAGNLVTGITGSAKDWAMKTDGVVNQSNEWSAKEYAIGANTSQTNGSAKQWAIGGGGSYDRDTAVSGSEYSAKYWANQAANTVATFDEKYYGAYSSDSAAETAHTNNGNTVSAGDLYFSTSENKLRSYNGTSWSNIEATDTTNFATKGFATAMAIAL